MTTMLTERQKDYINCLRSLTELGQQHSTMGQSVLNELWKIYVQGLYVTEGMYETFSEFVETEVQPSFENPDYLRDFVQVVDRVFRYVHTCWTEKKYIINSKTLKPVDVKWFIEQKGWIGKLISISQAFPYCKTDEAKRRLFKEAFLGTRDTVKDEGQEIQNEQILIKIPCIEHFNGDGSSTLEMPSLSKEQYQLFMTKMRKLIELRLD